MSRIRARFAPKKPEPQDDFDVYAGARLDDLQHLLELSGSPSASLHFEIDGKISKTNLRTRRTTSEGLVESASHRLAANVAGTQSHAAAPPDTTLSLTKPPESPTLYAIGSFTKILLNVAYLRIISGGKYQHRGLSWDRSACDTFNDLRREKNRRLMRRLSRDPTILELLVHRNAFAPMNQYLLAPDGSFIMSADEFLEVAPLITEDYLKGQKQEFVEYSNANHIFAALILEELSDRPLHLVMEEEVFMPLQMFNTAISCETFDRMRNEGRNIASGYRIHGNMSTSQPMPDPLYLGDSMEAAAFGAYSCTDDLAKLIRELLRGIDDSSDLFTVNDARYFFGPKCEYDNGAKVTLAGIFFEIDSKMAGVETSNRLLSGTDRSSDYELGRPTGERHCKVFYKAGTIDGFSCTVYVSMQFRAFVIVLTNSSGPVDVTVHMAHYTLQEALCLTPRVNIIEKVQEQKDRNSRQVRVFEEADIPGEQQLGNIEDFKGVFMHRRYGQKISIDMNGGTVFGYSKVSSAMKACWRADKLCILPGLKGFGIDRWDVWKDREYTLGTRNGQQVLIKCDSDDYFDRVVN